MVKSKGYLQSCGGHLLTGEVRYREYMEWLNEVEVEGELKKESSSGVCEPHAVNEEETLLIAQCPVSFHTKSVGSCWHLVIIMSMKVSG
jgi:hypothetical protein